MRPLLLLFAHATVLAVYWVLLARVVRGLRRTLELGGEQPAEVSA